MLDIGNDGSADIVAQWHHRLPPPFPVYKHLTRPPVNIIKTECRNLAGAQAKLGQNHQNRIVPNPMAVV